MRALKVLGWLWALPLSLVGLLLALAGGAVPYKVRPAGVLQLRAARGLWRLFLGTQYCAITIGAVTIFRDDAQLLEDLVTIRHERIHTYQCFVLGILFPFLYYGDMLVALVMKQDPYATNYFEEMAYRLQDDRTL